MSFARNIRIVHLLNRTTKPLNATWDGYPYVIPPGFKAVPVLDELDQPKKDKRTGKEIVTYVGNGPHGDVLLYPMPYFAAEAAMRQNPKMGTLNPQNPNDFEPLCCVPEWGHPTEHTEQDDEAIELVDRSLLPLNRQTVEHQHIPGSRRSPQTSNKWAAYGGRSQVSISIANPFGMQGDEMAGSAEYGR